ncbi:M24 family metallopeptidase [Corallococcus sp. EGB]|uniref:M24 family metallopeptidase n=1 Tax=Corallococcus sp. EGB TaxID=1521117 RepID=UPI001CBFE1CC
MPRPDPLASGIRRAGAATAPHGHGFGLGNHEPPWMAVESEHRLERNMLISSEAGVYVPGVGGYRRSDTGARHGQRLPRADGPGSHGR